MAAGLAVVRHFGLFAANCRLSSFAKASEDTPSSNDLRVACYPKLEERRVVPPDGIGRALEALWCKGFASAVCADLYRSMYQPTSPTGGKRRVPLHEIPKQIFYKKVRRLAYVRLPAGQRWTLPVSAMILGLGPTDIV